MLELRDLSRRYGDTVALDGLTLTAPQGEVVGFVGPNGAGKTTAMRIALGVLEADAGHVSWNGAPATREVQRTFGYMPEERGLYPKMRVDRQLRYFAVLHARPVQAADSAATTWIERLGLAEQAEKRVEELSLGNQQRVQLAAALVHDPEALILDEPFSGLDPIGTDVMSEIPRGARQGGRGRDLLVAPARPGRADLRQGRDRQPRIVAAGRVDELRAERAERRLRVELEGEPEGWLEDVPGAAVIATEPGAVIVELREGADDQQALDAARRAGRVSSFAPVRPTLGELFRELVVER